MIYFLVSILLAAPYPSTSSSAVVTYSSYLSTDWGFDLEKNAENWFRYVPSKSDPYHLAILRPLEHLQGSKAQLSIRVDPVSTRSEGNKVTLKSYTNHWLKQFPKLGIEVLKYETTNIKGQKALRIEAYNLNNHVQMRQYVVWYDQNAIIFTCADLRESFSTTLYQCERVLRSVKFQTQEADNKVVPEKNKI
jgi:hypothetical protein